MLHLCSALSEPNLFLLQMLRKFSMRYFFARHRHHFPALFALESEHFFSIPWATFSIQCQYSMTSSSNAAGWANCHMFGSGPFLLTEKVTCTCGHVVHAFCVATGLSCFVAQRQRKLGHKKMSSSSLFCIHWCASVLVADCGYSIPYKE